MRVFGFQDSGCGDPALEAYVGMHHIYIYIYVQYIQHICVLKNVAICAKLARASEMGVDFIL